jgi:aminoglycoside/choline kinase family phosphotransferase
MDQMIEYEKFIREALGLPKTAGVRMEVLFRGGSDRVFYRVFPDDRPSTVFMHYSPERRENNYYAAIAEFLRGIGVSVPRIIRHDPARFLILMEDLGDVSLWSLREAPWEERRVIYRKVLDLAQRLHLFPAEAFPSERVTLMEAFDPALYRWERDYFMEHFVQGVCGITLDRSTSESLEEELSALAGRLQGAASSLVHRDFQSRNVMICNGEPVFIDFQGMRFGNYFYDLGSLLYDPYIAFRDEERGELLACYYGKEKGGPGWETFQTAFREAAAQRLMQALGAYGFLGLRRGLREFLDHIPRGLDHLLDATTRAGSLPCLLDVAIKCKRIVSGF